jgi:dTDP-4-amino-4,6-dideoxygalactose transaminase
MAILPMDPKATFIAHREEILEAVTRVLDGGRYILGEETKAFESEFAAYCGVEHGIGVASGTDALQVALRAMGIGPGDAVLTVSHTAVATVAAIEMTGASAVLVDIDPATMNMSPDSLRATIKAYDVTHQLRAVIPVHLYGHPADMPAILTIAREHGLQVLEDCAQAHGAELLPVSVNGKGAGGRGQRVGSFGDAAAFSFYPTKNLGAFGDGGAIVTSDAGIADRARALREYGWRDRYISADAGVNSRLDELHAAMLRVKLRYLDAENDRRRQIAAAYGEALAGTFFTLPVEQAGARHVYHLYVIRTPHRDKLQAHLSERGVLTLVHYPQPVHLQPAYRERVPIAPDGLPVTEQVCGEILSLPMHPYMTDDEVSRVCEALSSFEE